VKRAAGCLAACLLATVAQAAEPYAEVRAYPSGVIVSGGALFETGKRDELGVSLAYNRAERGNAGRHDDESGDGIGIGVSGQRFLRTTRAGWFYGARAELFRLGIDWKDPGNRQGSSQITVLQPTARIGYRWVAQQRWNIDAAASLGAEINLATQGEKVGEGAIALIGIAISPR
jgi:hypothetical protein